VQAAITSCMVTFWTATAMAIYLIARRDKEPFHWMLCAYLAGLMMWTGGVLARYTVSTPDTLAVALRVIFSGILFASAFWLLTAVSYVYSRSHPARVRASVFVLVVSALIELVLFTNDGHRMFLRNVEFDAIERGPAAYVGPLFWVFLAWCYGCVAAGMVIFVRTARRTLRRVSRRRGALLALASLAPPVASTVYTFQLLPVHHDLTPAGLLVSMVLLWIAVFRYQLLEGLPLAREAALAHLDDGVVMASASGRVTFWNAAAERILGEGSLRPGNDLAQTLARGLAPADPRESSLLEARISGESGTPVPVRTADGRVIEMTTAVVDEGRGEPTGHFAILSDRTAIDRDERRARQTQRFELIGALAGEVVHQINDPLAFVRANLAGIEQLGARVAAEGDGPDASLAAELSDLRTLARETLEGVERIRHILDGMRDLATTDRQNFTRVDLARVVREAVRLCRDDAGRNPQVRMDLALSAPVHGNADRLLQLVLNLLVNARQSLAATSDARIDVALRCEEGEVELVVADNGPGIPEALRHRVFDPFFTTRNPDEGSGLGLAIAFDVAREHAGVLEVLPASGRGARLALRLPALEEGAGSDAGRPTRISGSPIQTFIQDR